MGASADAPPAKETLRLPGRVVTPGLVNTHTHSAFTMLRGVAADLGFAPSYTKGIPNALDLTPDDAIALARREALEVMLFGSTLVGEHFVHMVGGVNGQVLMDIQKIMVFLRSSAQHYNEPYTSHPLR